MKKIRIILLLCTVLNNLFSAVVYRQNTNDLEFQISVKEEKEKVNNLNRGIIVFIPKAPFDQATFIINMPAEVGINVPFNIDYAIKVNKFTPISFWADLIPDVNQEQSSGLQLLNINEPILGTCDAQVASLMNKGGKGVWNFGNGLLEDSIYQMRATFKAYGNGSKSFTSLLATNPPSYIGPVELKINNQKLVAHADNVSGHQNESMIIHVLDNDISSSPLKIVAVTQPAYGSISINEDNTLTYSPQYGYFGNDSLKYTVQDMSGKQATGMVSICIVEYQQPSIVL